MVTWMGQPQQPESARAQARGNRVTGPARGPWHKRLQPLPLVVALLAGALASEGAKAQSEGRAAGSLELEITSPATKPPNFTLNGGGTIPTTSVFPDPGNSGAGSLTGLGSASCTPAGCTDPDPGLDIQYQLSTDLTCVASDADASYGGLEDSFANFGATNDTGSDVTLGLRFTSSWSLSATATDPPNDAAEAWIFIVWAVPGQFCIELTSCPSGSLVSGSPSPACPAGFLLGGALELALSEVDTGMGDASDSGPESVCDVTVVVPVDASGGGDLGVTASCDAAGCPLLALSDDTVDDELTQESCRIEASTNYQVSGPNGKLTLRATRSIGLGEGFSVTDGGELVLEIGPAA